MIRKLLKTEFHKIYKLMEISFPKDEYRNYDKQLSLMDNPAYRIYVMPDMETDDIKPRRRLCKCCLRVANIASL